MTFRTYKVHTIMDGVVIRHRLVDPPGYDNAEISASRNGVLISGAWPTLKHERQIKAVIDVLKICDEPAFDMHRGETFDEIPTLNPGQSLEDLPVVHPDGSREE